MKRISLLILLPTMAVCADPVTPAIPPVPAKKRPALLTSDLNGRDMLFIGQAVEHGKILNFLATQAEKTGNAGLSDFGKSIVKSGGVQSAVIQSLAEMRKVRVAIAESAEQKKYAVQFSRLEGPELEKAILKALIDTNTMAVSFCELSEKSGDPAIRGCVIQMLPQLRENLVVAQTLAGLSPDHDAPGKARKDPAR